MEAESVPHVAPLHVDPVSVQFTPDALLATFAVKVCVCPPACKVAVVGATVTVMTGEVTVIVAVAVLVGAVTDVAVIVTVAGEGTLDGAV